MRYCPSIVSVVVLGLLMSFCLVYASRADMLAHRVEEEMGWLNHRLAEYAFDRAEARALESLGDKGDPVSNLERLRAAKRGAQRFADSNGAFDDLRDEYFAYVAVLDKVADEVSIGCEQSWYEERCAAHQRYHAAYVAYQRGIDDVRCRVRRSLVFVALLGSGLAAILLLLCQNLWRRTVRWSERCARSAVEARDAIVENLGVPAIIADADTRKILSANACACETFEYEAEDLVGMPLEAVLQLGSFASRRSDPQPAGGTTKHGEPLDMVVHATRTSDADGEGDRYTLVCQDRTAVVSKDWELSIQRKVVAQLAHEIRNKTTAAASMLELVQSVARNSDDVKGQLLAIDGDVTSSIALLAEADQLIETRLAIHKVYAGTYKSVLETVDLHNAMAAPCRRAERLANSNVTFKVVVPDAYVDCTIELDMYMFNHIANHYLSNARKAVIDDDDGAVVFAFLEETHGTCVFSVRDSGRGVPQTTADRLFVEEVASGDCRGIGLGLVSCARFAQAVGGRCWLHSTQLHQGSDFRFALPWRVIDTSPRSARRRTLPPNLAVFIVEDSPLIRKSIKAKLEKVKAKLDDGLESFTYVEFATCEAALESIDDILSAAPNALITVDQNLASAGGILLGSDLISTLVARDYQGVIASVSGDADCDHGHVAAGAHVLLGKPLPSVDAIFQALADAFAAPTR